MSAVLQRNNVKVTGRGEQPMLFAHGYGCDQNMWRFIAPAFEDRYRIVLFDHIGHGQSDASAFDTARYGSLQGYADDVLAICHELDLRDVIFVGHSVSAMIGALAAIKEPERFDRLILIGPSPRYINDGEYVGGFPPEDIESLLDSPDSHHLGCSGPMVPVIMGNSDRPALGKELTKNICRTHPEIAKQFARVTFLSDHRADLAKLMAPTLVLQCSDDLIAPCSVGEYMSKVIPHCTLRIIDNVGHCPHLSAPGATAQAMDDFLAWVGLEG